MRIMFSIANHSRSQSYSDVSYAENHDN